MTLKETVERILSELTLTPPQILVLAESFRAAMEAGMRGKESSLKMLPSFLGKPAGNETGTYAAIDFGGSKVRVLRVKLQGRRQVEIVRQKVFELQDVMKRINGRAADMTGSALFEGIAAALQEVLIPDAPVSLGHAFSFPFRQLGVNQAVLIRWTKEIKASAVEGEDVTRLLTKALAAKQMNYVTPAAVVNDTVGTYLASAYDEPATLIGSICGTGHNSCYLGAYDGKEMIINLESGNFDRVAPTVYDQVLDADSDRPGEQRLEKMVGGRYLGELFRLIIVDLIEKNLLFRDRREKFYLSPYQLKTEDLSVLLNPEEQESPGTSKFAEKYGLQDVRIEEYGVLRQIASAILTRAARLVGISYLGILAQVAQSAGKRYVVAMDGSLYEKNPQFASQLQYIIKTYSRHSVGVKMVKNGSGIGAAIAAAVADGEKRIKIAKF